MPEQMFNSIYVELTSLCDMACDFCPNSQMSRPRMHMDFDLFAQIIDQISMHHLTKKINLAAIGETLLYPKLLEAISYCKERNLETSLITNSLGLSHELYQRLSDTGLGQVRISLHDLTSAAFTHRHASNNITYEAYLEKIIGLIDYHVAHQVPVRLEIALMFSKEGWIWGELWDLPAIKENTINAGILLQQFIEAMHNIAGNNNLECCLTRWAIASSLRRLKIFEMTQIKIMDNVYLDIVALNPQLYNTRAKLNGPLGNKFKLIRKTHGSCDYLSNPMILSDGSFVPCCIDGVGALALGKVSARTPLMAIINGAGYQGLTTGFKNNEIINPLCQECRGNIEYKDQFAQIRHLVKTFDLQVYIADTIDAVKRSLRGMLAR